MTREDENSNKEPGPGRISRHILDEFIRVVRTTPSRMPDGGWLSGGWFQKEHWRTTTIVRRYRDQALRVIRKGNEPVPPVRRIGDPGFRSSPE